MDTTNSNNSSSSKLQYDVNEAFEAKLRYLKVSDLQHILRKHSLHTTGNKLSLIGRICDYFRSAITKANSGQIPADAVASMFSEVEAMYGNKLNTTRTSHATAPPLPAPIPIPAYIAPPSNLNTISNGASNGSQGLSAYINACFEDNSFCQHQSVLIQTRVLNLKESHGGHVFNFDLSKEVGNALYSNINLNNNTQENTKYCIQLFSFDTRKLEAGHQWPLQQTTSHFEIRVNHRVFQIKRAGKKDKDRVADITSYCRAGNNSITVLWNGSGGYQMFVTLSKRIPVETLVQTVLAKRSRDYEASLEAIKKTLSRRAGSDELQEVSTKVSLLCPATKAVMQIPCRATTCNHLQCFELQSYLLMNERVPRWQCPHCSKTALYKDLFADNFFKNVIEQVSKADITEIEFKPDATWLPVSKKRKVEQIQNTKPVFEILDEDDASPASPSQPMNNSNNNFHRTPSPTNFNNNNSATPITNTYTQPSYFPIFQPSANGHTKSSHVEAPEVSQFGYDVSKCFVCGASQSLKRCSRCRGICYCGTECQSKDWTRHKDECKEAITNGVHSQKAETDTWSSQPKFKIQKKDALSTLVESAAAQQPLSGSGNADNPIELD